MKNLSLLRRKKFLFVIIFGITFSGLFLTSYPVMGQENNAEVHSGNNSKQENVTGTVTDAQSDKILPGVNISVAGTTQGTSTDGEGAFELTVKSLQDTLVFSYIGYQKQIVPINGRTTINVGLRSKAITGQQLVVVGYGTEKASNITGSVSRVTNEKLDEVPSSRIDNALAGQLSGVHIQQTNPQAGHAPTIRVRGQGSITYDSDPLVVVDGIPVGNSTDYLTSVDMNDVKSVEVLKDASSVAIYGSRGANGVIMINTKKGKEGPTKFSYSGSYGFKSVPENDVLSSPSEWSEYVRANNDGKLTDRMKYINKIGTYTNWADVMFNGGSFMNHSLSARGGTDKTTYFASLNYEDDDGAMLTDSFKKYNFRINLNTEISDKLKFGIRLNPAHSVRRRFPIGVQNAIRESPWLPLRLDKHTIQFVNRYRENRRWADAEIGDYAMERMFDDYNLITGKPNPDGTGVSISTTSNQNSYAKVLERNEKKYQTNVYGNSFLRYDILNSLYVKEQIGTDYRYIRNDDYTGVKASRNGAGDSESSSGGSTRWHYLTNTTLNYSDDFQDHSIKGVLGFSYEHWDRSYNDLAAAGFKNDLVQTVPEANLTSGHTSKAAESLESYFARVNYSYADKYLLSLSGRVDGSSKFGPDTKYGFFPAGSVGWRVSDETFFKNNISFISNLKLRFSYGESGNNNGIGEYDYIGLLAPVSTGFGANGYNPQNISNPNLAWEKLVEINPGIDIAFLSGNIDVSFDYYNRKSKDLLINLPVPSVTGFTSALQNKGEVENKGVELEINTTNISDRSFTWTSTGILSHNKNTLVDFAGANGRISSVDPKRPAEWIAEEGQPIATFYGYVVKKELELKNVKRPFYPINGTARDAYVKDLNGDGVIDTDDRTELGSPYPKLTWSIKNSFSYKDLFLSFMFQGSHGAKVRNISEQYIHNQFKSDQSTVAGFKDADKLKQRIYTSDQIQNASFVTLRNLNLTYNVPSAFVTKTALRKASIYLSGRNLIYIMADDYDGFNPEGIDRGLDTPLTYGYQRGPAPIYRSVTLGINLKF